MAEQDQLSMKKKSKKQTTKNELIVEATAFLKAAKITVKNFMNKAVYWTVVSKSKTLLLNNPEEFKNLSSEIEKLENQTIQDL